MFNENSRMSRINDRNIYTNTDALYDPLRNALRKSTVSPSFLSPQNHSDNRLSASRIARNMRSLSPAETEIIKKNIFIPVNKELVPTRNLQKVMGKQFTAVDMEEKVGEAISPEEFSRVKTGTVEEIVYEMKEDERPANSIYTYTTRKSQPVAAPFVSYLNFPPQRVEVTRMTQPAVSTRVMERNPPIEYRSVALPNATSRQYFKQLPNGANFNPIPTQAPPRFSASECKEQTATKSYDFRQSTASKDGSFLRMKKQKEEYKYNLFSLIDQGGNNGCKNGCFGSNEICAPKITTNPWK